MSSKYSVRPLHWTNKTHTLDYRGWLRHFPALFACRTHPRFSKWLKKKKRQIQNSKISWDIFEKASVYNIQW